MATDIAAIEDYVEGRAIVDYVRMRAAYGNYSTAAALASGLDSQDSSAVADRLYALTIIAEMMIKDAAAP